MRANLAFTLSLSLLFLACDQQRPTRTGTVTKYYKAFDSGNYLDVRTVIHDSLTLVSGDYEMPYSRDSFYGFFKWDSIFKTSYDVVDVAEKDNLVLVKVKSGSVRYRYLENDPLLTKFAISFKDGKISKIEDLGSETANWDVWQKRVGSLVDWVKVHHPELDGFIYDMTMEGALKYVEAIRRYEASAPKK